MGFPAHPFGLLKLRVLVSILGESPHAGWWKTQFFSSTGLSYLGRLYPRSAFAAAVRAAGHAARAVHDSSIGIGHVFHAFRLPQSEELHLEDALREHHADMQQELAPKLSLTSALIAELEALAETSSAGARGPVQLGSLKDLQSGAWVSGCAAAYAGAFREGARVFPYIRSKQTAP